MIEYSNQESSIFGVKFGRLNIEENFADWDLLREEVAKSECNYIRVKIKNPRAQQLDQLLALAPKVHLLEILRVYRSDDLLSAAFENAHSDLHIEKVNENNKEVLAKFIYDTYDDIPFGNYTPASILEKFPAEKQLLGIIEYFMEFYTGKNPNRLAYLYFNNAVDKKPLGCVVSEFFDDGKGDSGAYSYYVGVARDERNKGIQYKVVNFIKFFVTERGYKYLDGSTRLTNLYSARTMEKNGCKCTRYDWVYLLEK